MPRKHYSLEYREQIVALAQTGRSITSVAKEFGLADQTVFTITAMCRQLRVSRSGYYAWRRWLPSQRAAADQALLAQIKVIHASSRGVYGAPRIHATLLARGVRTSRRRVARLMVQLGLRGVCRRRRNGKRKSAETAVIAPDQVRRAFRAKRPCTITR